jgi:hypothetical protein
MGIGVDDAITVVPEGRKGFGGYVGWNSMPGVFEKSE